MKYKDILQSPGKAGIRIHGNGFLQAETNNGGKIHVWDNRLPKQKVATPIHNHNHGFTSTILHGGLHMIEYRVAIVLPGISTHTKYYPHQAIPRKGKDTRLEAVGDPVILTNQREFYLQPGSYYEFPLDMRVYHHVEPMWSEKYMVITYVDRSTPEVNDLPTVLVRQDRKPDNEFNRYAFTDIAKGVYEDAITLIKEQEYDN